MSHTMGASAEYVSGASPRMHKMSTSPAPVGLVVDGAGCPVIFMSHISSSDSYNGRQD